MPANLSQVATILGSGLGTRYTALMNTGNISSYLQGAAASAPAAAPALNPTLTGLSTNGTLTFGGYGAGQSNAHAQDVLAAIFGTLIQDMVQSLTTQITAGCPSSIFAQMASFLGQSCTPKDPIIAMSQFGNQLATTTEVVFWTALGLAFAAWILTSGMASVNPLSQAMNTLMSIVLPIAMFIIATLWAAGITLGLYIPLIPYLVFTFAALSWMILVIESLLGASLIALSLVVPSEDELGKAGHAMVILLGLFLRPALMIVGFVFAAQLLQVAVDMINAGFWNTLIMNTGGAANIGVFGMVAVLFIYVGIITGVVHEAFSLIYVLPNKVLRWMGGGPEEEDAGKHAKELKGSADAGGQISSGLMKGGLSLAGGKK